MEKVIEIEGRPVRFRATAAIPRLYRIQFGRDVMQDMRAVRDAVKASQTEKKTIPPQLLEIFENMAFLMARHARPDMPEKTVEEWLEGFGAFTIYQIFPEIYDLWRANAATLVTPKKKHGPSTGK